MAALMICILMLNYTWPICLKIFKSIIVSYNSFTNFIALANLINRWLKSCGLFLWEGIAIQQRTLIDSCMNFCMGKKLVTFICKKNPEKYKTKETDFIMFRIEAFCSESNTQTKYDKGSLKVIIFFLKSKSLRNTN